MDKTSSLQALAKEIAITTLDISYKGKVGHIGPALSISDLLTVLYFGILHCNSANINSPDRDRFILSKGHAVASLYATLYKRSILSKKQLNSFAQNSGLCEHPEIKDPGIEMTTGSLGHGLAFGIGAALGQKKLKMKSRVFVLISDGESNEGSVWESALLGSKLKLDNLTVVIDSNNWQCMGRAELEPLKRKWESFGWQALEIDGHDIGQIHKAFKSIPFRRNKPSAIIAKTTTGRGISLIEDKLMAHYKVFNEEEYLKARKELMDL